jgi:predicted secreted hydrolase
LSDTQLGWDWFSLSFDTGDKLMGFQLRQTDGTSYSSATWINSDGTTTSYEDGAFVAEPLGLYSVAGRDVPTRWRVALPEQQVDVVVDALNPDAWMDLSIPYWEGPVRISGSHVGVGYLEMTGYE